MCGIVGYVGDRECKELLLAGLERLEYRGYDSAGICLLNGDAAITRRVGRVQALRDAVGPTAHPATTGLAHTRWATHGSVTESNAHPVEACEGSGVTVVHNGIIENYVGLRTRLAEAGHVFHTDTDSEVIAHLVESHYQGDLVAAVRQAYNELDGHFAFAVVHRDHPDEIVAARRQCPLVVGVGDGETFMASAISAFLRETRRVQYVLDDEIVVATPDGAQFLTGAGATVDRPVETVDWDDDAAEKQGFETFMAKEIAEQPDAIAETIGERLYHGRLELDGLNLSDEQIARAEPRRAAGLRHLVSRRPGRPAADRGVGAPVGRGRHRQRVALPQPGGRREHPGGGHLAVGRDRRHDRGHARGPQARRPRARHHQRDGQPDDPRVRLGALHARRSRDRRRRHQDLHRPGCAALPAGAQAGDGARDHRAGPRRPADGGAADVARAGAADARHVGRGRADRRRLLAEAVLSLPGPQPGPADGASRAR